MVVVHLKASGSPPVVSSKKNGLERDKHKREKLRKFWNSYCSLYACAASSFLFALSSSPSS